MADRFEMACPTCGSGLLNVTLDDFANRRLAACTNGCRVQLEDDGAGMRAQQGLSNLDRALADFNTLLERLA